MSNFLKSSRSVFIVRALGGALAILLTPIAPALAKEKAKPKTPDIAKFYDFSEQTIEGQVHQPALTYVEGHKAAKFDCDEFSEKGDTEGFKACYCKLYSKPGSPIADCEKYAEQAKPQTKLSHDIASSFATTQTCPKDGKDLEEIKKLSAEYDKNPYPVSISELIVFPLDVGTSTMEPHLPVGCGYNKSGNKWYKVNAFASEQNTTFMGSTRYPVSHTRHEQLQGEVNLQKATFARDGETSTRDGGSLGDLRYVPLGNGVYIMTARDRSDVFYHGLILIPSQIQKAKQACEKQQWLAQNKEMLDGKEIQDVNSAIRNLLLQGEALTQTRKVTEYLAKNKDQLPASAQERLRGKAQHLFDVIDGKAQSDDSAKLGENPDACKMFKALAQNGTAGDKPDAGEQGASDERQNPAARGAK